ncbi:helix-turn-helix transcriptional regulator [Halostreptopolyspora alba]|uniref:XRE family transcriptional regulator n=1 Tax=Halostreptopolyspora alba TaxID=2487137 RepID=A0A3N0E5R6_9ACTN|nr:XRE family transcriptional regulator [Nocardiopsaceae bacterium YIM 96095]
MSEQIRKARSARGWSQNRLIHEIERYARAKATSIAGTASLRVYVSEWENGKRSVAPPYTAILRAVLGMTNEELFEEQEVSIPTVDGYSELVDRIESAHSVSSSVVETLNQQTELLRTVDRQMGASQLVDQMTAHINTLTEALTFAVLPSAREPIAEALAGASTLAAWQALDVGATDRAWRHYEQAKSAAREAERPAYLAHAMGEQAYVLSDAGKPELSVELVTEALRIAQSQIPPRVTSWLLAAKAEFHALSGEESACRSTLESAELHMPDDGLLRDPDMLSIFLTEEHLKRWKGHSLALIGDAGAIDELYEALESMDSTFTRAEAGLRTDLAQAHMWRDEHGDATDQLRKARLLANRTGSVRQRNRIERLTGQA